ncbi:MAG TPA: protein kinase [Polyangiaceae bacterium]|nr:protein kinase [Polyangiaceae bacterium]
MQTPVEVGAVVGGKYRIQEFVGSGAMSVVALAQHLELEHLVAIKFLHAVGFDHEQSAQRFKREARAAAKIQSEHVTRVFDVGSLPDGCPYIVMEHLKGCDLAQELAKRGPLPATEVARYMLETCEALAEAHAAGIIHRDLKPENLFLADRADGSRSIKVVDFGISKSMSQSLTDLSLTGTASFMGSPLYMSPEQMRSSRNVDARTDIWSLGTVMYEMVSGNSPFMAESIPELCLAVVGDPPKPLREVQPNLPAGFEQVIMRCLEKDRDRRYASVAELAQALSPFAPAEASSALRTGRILARSIARFDGAEAVTGAGVSRTLPPTSTARPSAPAQAQDSSSPVLRRRLGSSGLRIAAAAVLALGLGALWMYRSEQDKSGVLTPSLAAEPAVPMAAATAVASGPRVEPVDRAIEVSANAEESSAKRGDSATGSAPRPSNSARARGARVALSAAREPTPIPSEAPKAAPNASAAKPVNAWDPSTFGGRY